MKTKWVKLMLTVLLGAVLSQDALAFYNSSTGRWLNRDPIVERGFKIINRSRELLDRHEERNLYRFAENGPIIRTDALGLQTDAEREGYCKDPCKEYADSELQNNEGWMLDGAAICCGGKLYMCAWGQQRWKNSKARELIKECIEQHEGVHGDKNHLQPCAPCNWDATKPGFGPGVNSDSAECEAHTAGEGCLSAAKAKCNGDSACEEEVEAARRAKESARDAYCKRAPKSK